MTERFLDESAGDRGREDRLAVGGEADRVDQRIGAVSSRNRRHQRLERAVSPTS